MNTDILDNGIEATRNFDWGITNRKICIFMPNYHDKKYTAYSIEKIKTTIPKEDYVIIIGNDNVEESFDEYEKDNVYYFTLRRPVAGMRNGGFIRNFVIKRCQSELFFQKDGEVVVLGDFIKSCIDSKTPWRSGLVYVLTEEQTEEYMKTGNETVFTRDSPTKKIDTDFPNTAEEVKKIIHNARGCLNLSTYFHYSYCIRTDVLKSINGYDEDYYYYGFEDSDIYCRLYSMGYKIIPDYSCTAVHLCHPRGEIDTKLLTEMSELFKNKDVHLHKRNGDIWGDGI